MPSTRETILAALTGQLAARAGAEVRRNTTLRLRFPNHHGRRLPSACAGHDPGGGGGMKKSDGITPIAKEIDTR